MRRVLDLLPDRVHEVRELSGPGRPWLVRYASRAAVLRRSDTERLRSLGFTPALARQSITWLHDFLRDLSHTGFVAPTPIADLRGESVAIADDGIWELLTFIPGLTMGWSHDELFRAGRLLARFHDASLSTSRRSQRPGAVPISACRPKDPDARPVQALLEIELADMGYDLAAKGVVHGDATQSNVVVDGGLLHLVDYALAYQEPVLFDVGSALWRNGRSEPNAVTYDAPRVASFVRGYHAARPLAQGDGRAIVAYMMGRGLQLQHRLELRTGVDKTVMQRLLSIYRQKDELRASIALACEC